MRVYLRCVDGKSTEDEERARGVYKSAQAKDRCKGDREKKVRDVFT